MSLTLSASIAEAEQINMISEDCFKPTPNLIVDFEYPWLNTHGQKNYSLDKQSLTSLSTFNQRISDSGKKLLVLFLPSPAMFTPKHLAPNLRVPASRQRAAYSESIARINTNGIAAPDVIKLYEGYEAEFDFQRRTDHHWTSEGAAIIGFEVARALDPKISLPPVSFVSDMLAWEYKDTIYTPPNYREHIEEFCELGDFYIVDKDFNIPARDEERVDATETLFGDQNNQIVVLGTSYSTSSESTFPRVLESHSGHPVLNFSMRGGGVSTAIDDFLSGGGLLDKSISTIIWEAQIDLNSSAVFGATSFANGKIMGGCDDEDLLFKQQKISGEFGDWLDVPSFHSDVNTFDIQISKMSRISFELTYEDGSTSIGSVFLQNGKLGNTQKDFVWSFYIPDIYTEDGDWLYGRSLRIKVEGHHSYDPKGSYDAAFEACLRVTPPRY
ncbi:MAG: alginate O-acetyltransferase AlgX-related protein [Marinosulfonomonas sp.]